MGLNITTRSRLGALADALPGMAEAHQRELSGFVLATAVVNAPRDTGELQDTADQDDEDPYAIVIYFPALHAKFVHDGTWKMSPRPFLLQAIEFWRSPYVTTLRVRLRALIAGVART